MMQPTADLGADIEGLADAAALFEEFEAACTLEGELTVSEWADRYRKIAPESGSPFPGDWRTDRVPYAREPMDCLHPDHPARSVTLKWSAQTALIPPASSCALTGSSLAVGSSATSTSGRSTIDWATATR